MEKVDIGACFPAFPASLHLKSPENSTLWHHMYGLKLKTYAKSWSWSCIFCPGVQIEYDSFNHHIQTIKCKRPKSVPEGVIVTCKLSEQAGKLL